VNSGRFRFEPFTLDPRERQLRRGEAPVALNGRYLDALALLVREQGRLVSKDRFLEEVWAGVPVTDEALTQCVRALRKALDDDATRPRFIATVPKHGYRFVAPVAWEAEVAAPLPAAPEVAPVRAAFSWPWTLRVGAAGTLGGGAAGAVGGLAYGLVGATQDGTGALSALLVLAAVTLLLGVAGGAGVAFGVAATGRLSTRSGAWGLGWWSLAGGAIGGLVVGAVVKLFGLDAFTLLLGRGPGDITGALEGALLGGAIGLGAGLGGLDLKRGVGIAALSGAGVGGLIPMLGGRLLGGSLDLLIRHFPGSRLRLDPIGRLFGETGFGPLSQVATAALEGALFCAGVTAAMIWARRREAVGERKSGEGAPPA
jgi:DNA-binding winged helix-turn-helix (wHTH) protein